MNIIRITKICICILPLIETRILFVFVFVHKFGSEYYLYSYLSKNLGPNIIRIRIWSKFWFRIIFVFVFGPKNSIRSPLVSTSAKLQTTNYKLETTNYKLQTTNYDLQNYKLQIPAPLRVSSSNTISDEELVTYNVKELNRVLKSKGDLNINYAYLTNVWKGQNIFMIDHHQ